METLPVISSGMPPNQRAAFAAGLLVSAFFVSAVAGPIFEEIMEDVGDTLMSLGEKGIRLVKRASDGVRSFAKKTVHGINTLAREFEHAIDRGRQIYEMHKTYTLLDLMEAGEKAWSTRDSGFSKTLNYLGVALASLARTVMHLFLGTLSLFSFDSKLISSYFYRVYIDITGFGIGFVGIFSPRSASEFTEEFLASLGKKAFVINKR